MLVFVYLCFTTCLNIRLLLSYCAVFSFFLTFCSTLLHYHQMPSIKFFSNTFLFILSSLIASISNFVLYKILLYVSVFSWIINPLTFHVTILPMVQLLLCLLFDPFSSVAFFKIYSVFSFTNFFVRSCCLISVLWF